MVGVMCLSHYNLTVQAKPMNPLRLGAHYEAFIRQQLDDGRFDTVSQLMREALRLLEMQVEGVAPQQETKPLSDMDTRSVFSRVRSELRLQP